MKIALTGKGGVGKTTLTSLLAKEASRIGYKVLVVDADPDANLAPQLGFEERKITPLTEFQEIINERTGGGGMLKLNPKVDDIPDKLCVEKNGIKLLKMETIRSGGEGCTCPSNYFLKALLEHILLDRDEIVFVDMEAGIEHLGRGTAHGVDALIVVINADKKSMETKKRIEKLATDIGIESLYVVANKIRESADKDMILKDLTNPPIGFIRYQDKVRRASRNGSPIDNDKMETEVRAILEKLSEDIENERISANFKK